MSHSFIRLKEETIFEDKSNVKDHNYIEPKFMDSIIQSHYNREETINQNDIMDIKFAENNVTVCLFYMITFYQ